MERTYGRAVAVVWVLVCVLCATVPAEEPTRLRLATTTSTDNTGMLDVFLPPFEKRHNIKVDVVSVGTGKAIKIAENGDADVILVHARKLEEKFLADGHGVNRRDVMHNDFVVLGPTEDPAGAKGETDAVEVMKKIAAAKGPFVSRGDTSGTHVKELFLWETAGIKPAGAWYVEAGQGMGATLTMADEKGAYTLCDRATYLAFRDKIRLALISEGDKRLYNPYGIIAVNPATHPDAKYMEAMMLIGWFTSREGQTIIGNFRKHGRILFYPDAVPDVIKK